LRERRDNRQTEGGRGSVADRVKDERRNTTVKMERVIFSSLAWRESEREIRVVK
jgi:hypothetical protein